MELQVRIQGSGSPVLCLHGHPGCGQSMAVFSDYLSQSFQTFSPDLRGYGRSQTAAPFPMEAHLEDLEVLLDRYQIQQCLVVGWSLGGILALELALHHPQRITGLVLVATAARPLGSHPPITWQDNLLTGLTSLLNWAFPAQPWVIDTLGRRSLYRYLLQRHTPYAYRQLAEVGIAAYLKTSRYAHQALNRSLRQGYNRLPAAAKLSVPALVLCAAEDRHITAASSLETAEALPCSISHCYPQAAHLFPWELPETMLADIDSWLQSLGLL